MSVVLRSEENADRKSKMDKSYSCLCLPACVVKMTLHRAEQLTSCKDGDKEPWLLALLVLREPIDKERADLTSSEGYWASAISCIAGSQDFIPGVTGDPLAREEDEGALWDESCLT